MKLSLFLRGVLLFLPFFLSADVEQVITQLKIADGLNGLASGSLDSGDGFGYSIATIGDLDHNGVNDIAMGLPGDDASGGDNNNGNENGAVWILTLDTDGSVLTQLKIADGLNGLASGSLDEGDQFGIFIATIGDLDHNGVNDIAVGAGGDDASDGDNNNGNENGAVWILTLDTDGSVLTQLKIADGLNGLASGSLDNEDGFGVSITTIGDLDHNGVNDIAVGAGGDDASDGDNNDGDKNGAVWILTLDTDGSVLTQLKIADGLNGLAAGSLDNEDQFGYSISTLGDLDHNGVNDIAVGSNGDSATGGDNNNGYYNGAVWILMLDTNGSVLSQLKIADGLNGLAAGSLDGGDNFGSSISILGDLDHNGVNDIAVGSIGEDSSGGDNDAGLMNGAVWILTLDTDGSVLTQLKIADGLNGLAAGSLNNFSTFGSAITTIDDLDGNGIDDIAVGAMFDDGLKGAVWILSIGEAPVVPSPTLTVGNFPSSISLGGVISATLSTGHFTGTVSYSTSGTLPQGLVLSGSALGGVITESGSFYFTVTATDGIDTANKSLSLTVADASINEVIEQNHYANTVNYQRWELDPNKSLAQPFAVTVIGTLPDGFKLTDTTVEGVIAQTGTYTFTLVVTSGFDRIEHRFKVMVVDPTLAPLITMVNVNGQYFPMNITTAPSHATPAISDLFNCTVQANTALEMTFIWDFIKDPFGFIIVRGELPQGLTLDGTSGVIAGTPTQTGEFIFVVSVKDWRSRAFQWVRLVVE